MKREKISMKELIERNKQELLKDSLVIEKIEKRVDEKLQQKTK